MFEWVGVKAGNGGATETTTRPTGHMNYTQAPVVCEKNIFSLIFFHQAGEKLVVVWIMDNLGKPC